jgi:hypothetical protein
MKTGVLTLSDIGTIVRPDFHLPLDGVSTADASPSHHCHRHSMGPERSSEPLHSLDSVEVGRTMAMMDYSVNFYEYGTGQIADG